MVLRVVTILSLALAFILSSCAPQEHSQIVLAEFGNQKVRMGQFEKAYVNNAGSYKKASEDSLSKLKNFLNLYVDFRMKLRNAYVRGFDQDSSLQKELKDYKNQVAVSYYTEHNIIDPAIHKLYERRKWELRVSHIMIVPGKITDKQAEEKAEAILDSIKSGASFAEMAKKYSMDRFSAPNGGDLFYITAGELPPSFEDACYATQPGHVYPHVVRTRYGYHIIKVTDKRPRVPEIRASHILVGYRDKKGKIDTAYARAVIDTVMQKLKEGDSFVELAKEYSDDPGSKDRGGDLGYFSIRQMVEPFAEAAFNLKKVGDISGVVQTRFGFHIIKLTGKKPYPTFDEDKDKLKKIYMQQRYQDDYDSLVTRLKKKFNYTLNPAARNAVDKASDTVTVGEPSKALNAIAGDTLFTYNGGSITVGEFIKQLYANQKFAGRRMTPVIVNDGINVISGDAMIKQEALETDENTPEFKDLMQNYRNGIYIFKLQQDEVWDKIKIDSAKLYSFFLKHRENYMWPERVDFAEIFVRDDSAINDYYKMLQDGSNFDTLAAKYTERPGYKAKDGVWGLQDSSSSLLASTAYKLNKPGDYSKPFRYQGGYSIVELIKKEPPREKTFEEAKAEVSGAYQEVESKDLENNYIESLKKLYHPKIFYNKLEEAFKPTK